MIWFAIGMKYSFLKCTLNCLYYLDDEQPKKKKKKHKNREHKSLRRIASEMGADIEYSSAQLSAVIDGILDRYYS